MFQILDKRLGNTLPVSSCVDSSDGRCKPAQTSLEKRFASLIAPRCNKENCIMCNMCSLVCPHSVIRPYLLDEVEFAKAPESIKERCQDAKIGGINYKFVITISE